MNGQDMIAMDVALFMATIFTAGVNAFYLPACWRVGKGIAITRLLRLSGWLVLASRYGVVLFTTGDILTSIPAAVGLFLLAAGEITALLNRGQRVPL